MNDQHDETNVLVQDLGRFLQGLMSPADICFD